MTYRTSERTAERKNARRRSILDAATRLFGRHGYHATTVPMIVAEAGTSTGGFYFYFRNKEDVFAATLSAIGERMTAAIDAAVAEVPHEPLSGMRAAVSGLVAFLAQNPADARILIVESSGLGQRLEQVRRSVIAAHRHGVERALRHVLPTLTPAELDVTARCWTGAVYEVVYGWLELPDDQRPPANLVAEMVVRFNLRGIGAPPDRL